MSRVVNLTIPLYDHMPVGNVWAWDVPFQTREITTYDRNACRLFMISMHNETGTRHMWGAVHHPEYPQLDQLDLGQFINRPAAILPIPKGPYGEITREDVEAAFARADYIQDGDAIIFYTGWGDGRRWKQIGDDYARQTPHWGYEGAKATVEQMKKRNTNWLLTDCAYIGNTGESYMRRQWAELPAWRRAPFPSPEARAYLRNYTREMHWADWGSSVTLTDDLFTTAALCNIGELKGPRTVVTCLPMIMENCSGASCTVVALEQS